MDVISTLEVAGSKSTRCASPLRFHDCIRLAIVAGNEHVRVELDAPALQRSANLERIGWARRTMPAAGIADNALLV